MNESEIIAYFALKNMGSKFSSSIDVVWEKLDESEKEMISSIYKSEQHCNLLIKSDLSQDQLEEEIYQTASVELS